MAFATSFSSICADVNRVGEGVHTRLGFPDSELLLLAHIDQLAEQCSTWQLGKELLIGDPLLENLQLGV